MDFTFKQFQIRQDRCAMKVGTDGVLLGAWAKGGERILDIGTGTGLVALMMAQRYPASSVDAIEIDREAALQAEENFTDSKFSDRLKAFHTSLQDFTKKAEETDGMRRYDAIVSNPPYFVNSLKNNEQNKTIARHTERLSFKDLISCACKLLKDDGCLSLVLPSDAKHLIELECISYGFSISKLVYIKTKSNKKSKRILLELTKVPQPCSEEEVSLMNDDASRSYWYENLTKEFYIK